jgi:hypothetical protein
MTVLFYCCAMGLAVNMVSRSGITWRFEKLYSNQASEVIINSIITAIIVELPFLKLV